MTQRSLVFAVLVLAACAPDIGPSPEAPITTDFIAKSSQGLSTEDAKACGLRYVGIADSCPAPTDADWTQVSLTLPEGLTSPVVSDLEKYCIYEWEGASLPDVSKLPPGTFITKPQPDCHVVGTEGPITTELGYFVFETYTNGVNRPAALPPAPDTSVLAVVDTSPSLWLNGQPGIGQFEHGRSVASAARRLSCHNGNCSVDIFPILGLPRTAPNTVDTVNGGAFGFQSELAMGIIDAVHTWAAHRPTSRLVINLSVGWQGRFNTLSGGATRPSVDMVRDALRYARCHGALIFGAAGNKTYDTAFDDGPIYPAAWVSETAPDTSACDGIDALEVTDVRQNPTDPLIVPIAGVTRYDAPLPNARNFTRTELEAPGANVSVWDVQNSTMRPSLTGSSMSTAAVSAAAATLWAYRPKTPPHELLGYLQQTGVDLSVPADLCTTPPCANVRRISMCSALKAVCDQPDSKCNGFTLDCQPVAAYGDFAPAARPNVSIDVDVNVPGTHGPSSYAACGNIPFNPAHGPTDPACFNGAHGYQLRPWVDPQPAPFGCDICSWVAPRAFLRFYDNPDPFVVMSAKLYFSDGNGNTAVHDLSQIDPNLAQMNSGSTYKVQLNHSFTPTKGWIYYKVDGVLMSDTLVIY